VEYFFRGFLNDKLFIMQHIKRSMNDFFFMLLGYLVSAFGFSSFYYGIKHKKIIWMGGGFPVSFGRKFISQKERPNAFSAVMAVYLLIGIIFLILATYQLIISI